MTLTCGKTLKKTRLKLFTITKISIPGRVRGNRQSFSHGLTGRIANLKILVNLNGKWGVQDSCIQYMFVSQSKMVENYEILIKMLFLSYRKYVNPTCWPAVFISLLLIQGRIYSYHGTIDSVRIIFSFFTLLFVWNTRPI
jgi:hypothetical protein